MSGGAARSAFNVAFASHGWGMCMYCWCALGRGWVAVRDVRAQLRRNALDAERNQLRLHSIHGSIHTAVLTFRVACCAGLRCSNIADITAKATSQTICTTMAGTAAGWSRLLPW